MKKGLTEVIFVLDASGSMVGLKSDTIGGFNSVMEEQRKIDGDVLVSVVTFNAQSRVVYDRVDISKIKEMTVQDYAPVGSTALVDAMGDAIHHISNVHKYIREEDIPEHTIFFVTTDGMENSSHRYTSDELKGMVETKKELGWDFVFLAANIDTFATADRYGFLRDYSATYVNDSIGVAEGFRAMESFMRLRRQGDDFSEEWKDKLKDNDEN